MRTPFGNNEDSIVNKIRNAYDACTALDSKLTKALEHVRIRPEDKGDTERLVSLSNAAEKLYRQKNEIIQKRIKLIQAQIALYRETKKVDGQPLGANDAAIASSLSHADLKDLKKMTEQYAKSNRNK